MYICLTPSSILFNLLFLAFLSTMIHLASWIQRELEDFARMLIPFRSHISLIFSPKRGGKQTLQSRRFQTMWKRFDGNTAVKIDIHFELITFKSWIVLKFDLNKWDSLFPKLIGTRWMGINVVHKYISTRKGDDPECTMARTILGFIIGSSSGCWQMREIWCSHSPITYMYSKKARCSLLGIDQYAWLKCFICDAIQNCMPYLSHGHSHAWRGFCRCLVAWGLDPPCKYIMPEEGG